ncbi:MAG: trimethylamine methyltransferase family protein [Geminicoccaceae bacterium]
MDGTPVAERTRRGGRAARHALRSRPLDVELRPVRPGLAGGAYRPLDEAGVAAIDEAALTVLETIGLANALPGCIDLVTAAGGRLDEQGRLLFPRELVHSCLATAARHFTLHGRDPVHDMQPGGRRVHFGTAGAAVNMVDPESRDYRDTTLSDLFDIARLVDRLEHIHFFQRSVIARDLPDPRELDINTLYACIAGTTKHVGTSFTDPDHVREGLAMLHLVAGSEEAWRARPFVSMSCCFVVPPLRFAEDACRCLEAAVAGGMPVLLLAAGQAGATSPASLAGAVVQEVAEVLAGIVYVNLLEPGHPAIFGTWPFVSDLRTGAMSGGSGEQALMMAACAQMAHFYDLPGGVASGMADSKLADAQAGAEVALNHALVGNAGANLIYEAAGMRASLLGFSLEGLVLDNDIIGSTLRTIRGLETDAESLAIDVMREVCREGPGHYLGHADTLARMQKDYIYPAAGDRKSPKEWLENGSSDALERAAHGVRAILANDPGLRLDAALDRRLRANFPIRLPRPG